MTLTVHRPYRTSSIYGIGHLEFILSIALTNLNPFRAKAIAMPDTNAGPPEPNSLVELHFPERVTGLVWLAILTGFILVGTSIIGNRLGLDLDARSSILVSSGIALILAAFGGQATVRGKGYVFAGVAGIAAGMLFFLEYSREKDWQRDFDLEKEKSKNYVRGLVHDIPGDEQYSAALLMGGIKLKSIYLDNPDMFAFAVFRDQVEPVAYASLRLEAAANENEDISIAVATSCFESAMGSEKPLDWALRSSNGSWEVVDRRNSDRVLARLGGDRVEPCPSPVREVRASFGFGLVANAQEANSSAVQPTPDEVALSESELSAIASALVSDEVAVRRSARHDLAGGQADDIIGLIQKNAGNYRIKLGGTVALVEKFRNSYADLQTVSGGLSVDEKSTLLHLAGDKDATIRAYGGELMSYVSDVDMVTLAASKAASAENEEEKEIWAAVTRSGFSSLSFSDREDLAADSTVNSIIVN